MDVFFYLFTSPFLHQIVRNIFVLTMSDKPLWLEFLFTLEYFFRYGFWVANISNVSKYIKKMEVRLTVKILRFRCEMLSLPNAIRI